MGRVTREIASNDRPVDMKLVDKYVHGKAQQQQQKKTAIQTD
jgi:hypothetical protein